MRRRTGPIQQWVDSIPSPAKINLPVATQYEEISVKPHLTTKTEPKDIPLTGSKPPSMTVSAPINVPGSPAISLPGHSSLPYNRLIRDPSLQSDSSHCSSVESLLELRRADPEAILLGLGFGGCSNSPQDNGPLSRIPKRFLQPSKLKGIAINDFVRHQQETSESFDSVSLGYRGLTGSPYVAPSEIVQKIMERLREHESHEVDPCSPYNYYDSYSPMQQTGTHSVLSPDNRQFLERPRSKSPDMRNKRMIIGQKSFAFGHDGDLIEINPSHANKSSNSSLDNEYNGEDTQMKESIFSPKADRKLVKQLSFNDSMELSDIDTNLETQHLKNMEIFKDKNLSPTSNTNSDSDDHDEDDPCVNCKEDNFKYCPDIRRASEGSCEIKFPETVLTSETRRHSDSVVHTIESSYTESVLPRKRRTLKRQSRVTDTDYCSLCVSDPQNCKQRAYKSSTANETEDFEVVESIRQDKRLSHETRCGGAQFTTGTHECVQQENNSCEETRLQAGERCCAEETQLCCFKDTKEHNCRHTENCTGCCCHSTTSKYWKKMERRMIQRSKQLENIVVRNRREVAEIREMLSSVFSVRMEPGF